MENTQAALGNGCRMEFGVDSLSGSLCTNQAHALIRNEIVEHTHCIGAAADAGNDTVRQSALFSISCFFASSPMTFWKSRTMVGYGCGPITEPIR